MSYEYCITKRGSRKTCCNKLANILNTEKWRVVDRKTNRVLYVFSRKTQ
jgi:hypothetical protein